MRCMMLYRLKVATGFPNILTGHIAPLSSINTTAGGLLDAEIEDNGLFINNPASGVVTVVLVVVMFVVN